MGITKHFLLNLCLLSTLVLSDTNAQELPVDSRWLIDRYTDSLRQLQPEEIKIEKELLYDKYTLEDEYDYNKGKRLFQWDTIRSRLIEFESLVANIDAAWGILQNYKTSNGTAALVGKYGRDSFDRIVDIYGVERYQASPVYGLDDTITPVRYARDGALVRIDERRAGSAFVKVWIAGMEGQWMVPNKYLEYIEDGMTFKIAIFVDKTNQNIATLERIGMFDWLVRSMNPATTGHHKPPYAQETPSGMFVLQDRKPKMFYLVDGTNTIAGYAPWANRFTRGAYIHGVPTNNPNGAIIEHSWTLGTTKRSHMCVRNVSSHSKFIYDWAPLHQTLIFVIE